MFQRSQDFTGKSPNIVIDVPSIDEALREVEEAGGKIATDKMPVGDMGFAGYFTDTEDNLIGRYLAQTPELARRAEPNRRISHSTSRQVAESC